MSIMTLFGHHVQLTLWRPMSRLLLCRHHVQHDIVWAHVQHDIIWVPSPEWHYLGPMSSMTLCGSHAIHILTPPIFVWISCVSVLGNGRIHAAEYYALKDIKGAVRVDPTVSTVYFVASIWRDATSKDNNLGCIRYCHCKTSGQTTNLYCTGLR